MTLALTGLQNMPAYKTYKTIKLKKIGHNFTIMDQMFSQTYTCIVVDMSGLTASKCSAVILLDLWMIVYCKLEVGILSVEADSCLKINITIRQMFKFH